jgi:mannose-6-phosphate isomerase-like protein (cupin superfamily)
MDIFELATLAAEQREAGRAYREFLRVPEMSLGIYLLPAGGVDPQQPHTEAEAYYVISGRAQITVGDVARPVSPGSLVYVAAGVDHRFHDIAEDLALLVFFAPAEYSRSQPLDEAAS